MGYFAIEYVYIDQDALPLHAHVRERMKIRVGAGKSCAGQLSVSRNRRSAIL